MADRYWVGGAGTWDATTTTNWAASSGGASGASAPTSVDNAIFDSLSNATLYTVTVGATAVCENFTVAAPLTGAVTFSLPATARLDCYGSMTLPAANCTWTSLNGSSVTFRATTTGKTVTTNGVSFGLTDAIFNGVGGGWTLGSAFLAEDAFSFLAGTLDSANFNITCGYFTSLSSSNRTLTLGSSVFTTTNASTGGWQQITSGSTFTLNAGTSQIISNAVFTWLSSSDFSGKTFYNVRFTRTNGVTVSNANTYNEIDFSAPAPNANFAITGSNTIASLKIATLSALGVAAFTFSADQTITGTFTVQTGNTDPTKRTLLRSNTSGTQRTLTAAAISFGSGLDFQDIVAAGAAAPFDVSTLAGGNGLNNSNITFPAAKDAYWNLAAGGNWSATGWALSSGGAVNANNFPLAQDRVIIENTGLNTSATITINAGFLVGELDLSTRSNAMTLASGTQVPRFYKNVTLSSVVTMTGTGAWTFAGQGTTQILDVNTVTFVPPITIDASSGALQLAENTICSATTTLTSGTLNLNNQTLTCLAFSSTNTNTRAIAFGTGNITTTGSGTVWTTATPTNFSYTGTPTVNIANNSATATTVSTGALIEARALNFNYTVGSYTLTDTNAVYKSLNFTGFTGTIPNSVRTIYGNLTLVSGMTLTAGANATTFAATSGTNTITTALKTLDFPLTFNGIGGTFAFQDALTQGATRAFTVTNGTVQLKARATSTVGAFATSGTNQKFLQSTTPGTQATLSKASGVVNTSYLTIQDIFATGGATWNSFYSNGNLDGGNNTNWIFGETPAYGAEYEYKLRSFTEPRRF